MKKIISLILLSFSISSFATVKHFDKQACRSLIWGPMTESDYQTKINKDIQDELDARHVEKVDFIKYGDAQSWLRDKTTACIIATVWYEDPLA